MSQTAAELRTRLGAHQAEILSGCDECGLCVNQCVYLQRSGNPLQIAAALDGATPASLTSAFDCTLCGLCTSVCPQQLPLDQFFLEMRREAVDRNQGEFSAHSPLKKYEELGTSKRFTLYRMPQDCTTIFFPGCSLSGTRPEGVNQVFRQLQQSDARIGIVFDCCLKPSHSLGREAYVDDLFSEMRDWLVAQGVKEVLVACPNCQVMFEGFGQGLQVRTVWEALADAGLQPPAVDGTVTVHDPCVIRNSAPTHAAVRTLLQRQGLTVEEMPHCGPTTVCCGKGGGVDLLRPELAGKWKNLRRDEAAGRRIISYCAGCVQALGTQTPTSHLVDILFDPQAALADRKKGTKAPWTYLNRLRLKRAYQRKKGFAVSRERTPLPAARSAGKSALKPLILLALLATVITTIQLSGAGQYLQQDKLQALIADYGMLAPAIYMLIYALAPVLFLPGLPITIVGGLLFGPLWGVVYTMIGATSGATLAFLTARYLARDWVTSKLTGPKWSKLDSEVGLHGWKVVAFTRLIPVFPFNLLNYAFGLTRVGFVPYVVTTFVCMLPACIAFIVFSSSLFDLLRGSLSPRVALGLGLVVLVSLIPVVYRRVKGEPKVVEN